MQCHYHPDTEAVATCPQCGKPICRSCAVDVGGKITCQNCLATVPTQAPVAPSNPNNRMALWSMIVGLASWLLNFLMLCFNFVIGPLIGVATMGLGLLCVIPIGLIGILSPIGWVVSIILGHIAIRQLKEGDGTEGGRGMALTGLISGYIGVGLMALSCLAAILFAVFGGGLTALTALFYELGY